jgi:hypothetical protein
VNLLKGPFISRVHFLLDEVLGVAESKRDADVLGSGGVFSQRLFEEIEALFLSAEQREMRREVLYVFIHGKIGVKA